MKKLNEELIKILEKYTIEKELLKNIDDETNIIKDLGINSARNIDIIIDIEEKYNIIIDDQDIKRFSTLKEIRSLINDKLSNSI